MRPSVPMCAAIAATLALFAAPVAGARVADERPPVLGAYGLMGPYGEGWGTAAPRGVYNGSVPAGRISGIRWRRWGERVATGRGRTSAYKPGGGYYQELVPVRVRALRLGRCPSAPGRRAYTRMTVSHRVRPGGPWTAWGPWTLDLCDAGARPRSCDPVAMGPSGDHGAFEITAWDVRCRMARRLARASRRVPIRPDDGDPGLEGYGLRARGFTCAGYALRAPLPTVAWTCQRGPAQVTFKRA